jgi:hypothetical protein
MMRKVALTMHAADKASHICEDPTALELELGLAGIGQQLHKFWYQARHPRHGIYRRILLFREQSLYEGCAFQLCVGTCGRQHLMHRLLQLTWRCPAQQLNCGW